MEAEERKEASKLACAKWMRTDFDITIDYYAADVILSHFRKYEELFDTEYKKMAESDEELDRQLDDMKKAFDKSSRKQMDVESCETWDDIRKFDEKYGLKRDPKIRENLIADMAQVIDNFWKLHSTEPNTGFSGGDMAEAILAGLEKKNWHGVKE